MNLLTVMELGLVAFGLALFLYGKIPRRDPATGPLVRGAGLVLTLPVAMGLVVRAVTRGGGMGPGAATILTAAIEFVSLLVCATLSVLLCANAGGSHRGSSA